MYVLADLRKFQVSKNR